MGAACLAVHLCIQRDCSEALPNNCILPFFLSLLQVSTGDHGQWIRGNFSFNGKYPEFSSLKVRVAVSPCPGQGPVLRDGGTDRQTDGGTDTVVLPPAGHQVGTEGISPS